MNTVRTHRPGARKPALRAAVVILAGLLTLTACTPVFPDATPQSQDPAVTADAPENLKEFYTQQVSWSDCEKSMQCAKVKVPMDYANPQTQSIELSVVKLAANGTKTGSIVVNPGGPGGSGYDMVAQSNSLFSKKLRGSYDMVGFDPRGVKRSAPVTCLSDAEQDKARQTDYDLDTDAGLAAYEAQSKADAAQCQQKTGPVLGFVDTISSAKDLDVLRAILNSPKLDYLGYSYGTKLGANYAQLFPDKVGKFVLDGALDPSLTIETLGLGQAKGFEAAILAWAANCVKSSGCPLRGTPEQAVQQIRDLNATYDATPQKTNDGRLLTGAGFNSALSLAMYSTDLWTVLQSRLGQAFKGDPNGMMELADYAADRDPNSGKYTSNTAFAFTAINCLDYQMNSDVAAMRAEAQALQTASPTFGKYLGYSAATCKNWPYASTVQPKAITAEGTGPIVVIGTTRDPATPYAWAQALRNQLAAGVLVTWNGDGHTAYGRSNACVQNAVDDYFVEGKTPQDGLTC